MLTKELLSFRIHKGLVKPNLIAVHHPEHQSLAREMIALAQNSVGKKISDALQDFLFFRGDYEFLAKAFEKLITDRFEFEKSSDSIQEYRWKVFAASEKSRKIAVDYSSYIANVESQLSVPIEDIRINLFEDHPDFKKILNFEDISPQQLIEKFNLSQVQGLLFFARNIKFLIEEISVAEKRTVLRAIKYYGLIPEISKFSSSDDLEFTLGGPASVIQHLQIYALRIAAFFPLITAYKKWRIEADVKLKSKHVSLTLDQSSGIRSNIFKDSYVPEEIRNLKNTFSEKFGDRWLIEENEEALHIESKTWIIPDFVLAQKSSPQEKIYLEIFHKWHLKEFEKRLQQLRSIPNLKLAAEKNIWEKVQDSLKELGENRVLVYRDFPTSMQLNRFLL